MSQALIDTATAMLGFFDRARFLEPSRSPLTPAQRDQLRETLAWHIGRVDAALKLAQVDQDQRSALQACDQAPEPSSPAASSAEPQDWDETFEL